MLIPAINRTATLGFIPDGANGIRATLRAMSEYVNEYKKNLIVRGVALRCIQGVPNKDWAGEVRACFNYVYDNIRYTQDITGVETLHTPDTTLQIGQGDCDDMVTLLCAMLESIGHPTRFVAIGTVNDEPDAYSHVYCQTIVGNRWVSLDPTMPHGAGWEPPAESVTVRMVHYN